MTICLFEMETWRIIPSLPQYLASTQGRLMRVPFIGAMPHGGTKHYGGKPTIGVWHLDQRRYCLMYRGHTYKVARLICEAFHGAAPLSKPVCMHLDENSRNNKTDNLAWGTQKENLNAQGFVAYCHSRTGENNPFIKGRVSA